MSRDRHRCIPCGVRHFPKCKAPAADRVWPLQPLMDIMGRDFMLARWEQQSLYRAMETGLSDARADAWAVRCGLHPESVWPGWCDAALTEMDRAHLAGGWRQAWEWAEAHPTPAAA